MFRNEMVGIKSETHRLLEYTKVLKEYDIKFSSKLDEHAKNLLLDHIL